MSTWFLARDKKKLGPFTQAQLQNMAQEGDLQPEDMILQDGTARWVPAGSIPELAPQPLPQVAAVANPKPAKPKKFPSSILALTGKNPKDIAAGDEIKTVFTAMGEMVMQAHLAILQQDSNGVEVIKARSNMLYEHAAEFLDDHERLLLNMFRLLIFAVTEMVHSMKKYQQAQFDLVQKHCSAGYQECQNAMEIAEQLGDLVARDANLWEIPFHFQGFAEVFQGIKVGAQAEEAGYRGDIRAYTEGTRQCALAYRKAVMILAPCQSEGFVMVRASWAAAADNLELRARSFEERFDLRNQYLVPNGKKVFIIHGHDEKNWRSLQQLLSQEWGLESVILRETVNLSRTVIDKFMDLANECGYALCLMTPDDFVSKNEQVYHQARPNVIFELGWFFGRYGPERISMIKQKSTILPSDLGGILCLEFQDSIQEVKEQLMSELRNVKLIEPEPARKPSWGGATWRAVAK